MFVSFTGVVHVFFHININAANSIDKSHEADEVRVNVMLDWNAEQIAYRLFGQFSPP